VLDRLQTPLPRSALVLVAEFQRLAAARGGSRSTAARPMTRTRSAHRPPQSDCPVSRESPLRPRRRSSSFMRPFSAFSVSAPRSARASPARRVPSRLPATPSSGPGAKRWAVRERLVRIRMGLHEHAGDAARHRRTGQHGHELALSAGRTPLSARSCTNAWRRTPPDNRSRA